MKLCIQVVFLAILVSTTIAFGQVACTPQGSFTSTTVTGTCTDDVFQLKYAANMPVLASTPTPTAGESLINVTNTGAIAASTGQLGFGGGNLCINLYVFDPQEEELACCSCQITPNSLWSTDVKGILLANNLTPENPTSAVVKALASTVPTGGCNASTVQANNTVAGGNILAPGMRIWGTTLHQSGTAPSFTYGTETEFAHAGNTLSQGELNRMTILCAFIQANGTLHGQCAGCTIGGLGAQGQ